MEKLVSLAKVLSDINRVKIIALMHREKEVCVCEICDTLELSQPLVSRHLKQMREADIVVSIKKGKWMLYKLTKNNMLDYILDNIEEKLHKLPKLVVCKR